MSRVKLTYADFRPTRAGETGYKAKWYISESTGELIPVARFQKLAHGGLPYSQRRKQTDATKQALAQEALQRVTPQAQQLADASGRAVTITVRKRATSSPPLLASINAEARYSRSYQGFLHRYWVRTNGDRSLKELPPITYRQAQTSPDFVQAYAVLKAFKKGDDTSSTGPLALALVALKLRDLEDTSDLGMTDTYYA
jgi:histone H3/H4